MASSEVEGNASARFQRIGRLAAGSLMASANVAQRGFHTGLGAWARMLRTSAEAAGDAVPGAGRLAGAAGRTAEQSTVQAEQAERRRAQAMAFARDGGAGDEAGGAVPAWAEIAAETMVAPLASAATLSLLVGEEALGSGPSLARRALGRASGGRGGTNGFDRVERGESFVAVAREAGTETLRQTFDLAEAAARLAAGDPEHLRVSIDEGLAQMRLLAAAGELGDLLPASPLDEPLQRRARLVVERSPKRFLGALERNGHRPRPTAVLQAAFHDADELRVFLVVYPQTLSLIAAKVGRLLVAGELELRQIEAFLRGRRRAAGLA